MYDAFSTDYDRFVNWTNRLSYEMPFLLKVLGTLERQDAGPLSVLDAACGTGMHAIELAKHGFRAAGADLSAGMIERAKVNAWEKHVSVDFKAVGFGELASAFSSSPLFPFDSLLCLGNSLPHLLTLADLSAALQDFSDCLRPGGLLVLQNRNFDAVMKQRERWMEPQSHREISAERGQEEWVFLRFYDYLPDGLIDFNIITLYRTVDPSPTGSEPWEQRITTTRLRPLLQFELADALVSAGFKDISFYGNLAGQPFDPAKSGNLVVTARK